MEKSIIDIDTWNRRDLYKHFITLQDPIFGIVANVDVTKAYQKSKEENISFFALYLFASMKAINAIENFRYRIEEGKVVCYPVIDASATIIREDKTFGFSYIDFSDDLEVFVKNFELEKERILGSNILLPPKYTPACIYCSAIPWVNFTGHKEPFAGDNTFSIPQLAFGKFKKEADKLLMPVSVNVNHALMDGYHVGQFYEKFQIALDKF